MLDLICTFYDYKELELQVNTFKNSQYNPIYICNWENEEDVLNESKRLNTPINWLDYNPNQHDGTFGLAASSIDLITNPYVLHYHADIQFNDISALSTCFDNFVSSNCKLGGIPRQWVFDNNGVFQDNKSLPFRSEVFFCESNLYKKIFDFNSFDLYREKSRSNNHPSLHFEPVVYAAAELHGVDFSKDIFYLEDPIQMKNKYGNKVFYYNETFETTKITRLK